MKVPEVSVVIPVYNTAATLARCIDSVLAQTFADLEIVLVDDGSTDGAGGIADEYAARHSNILVIHQANKGLAEARHAGIHAARGTYIVPLDSDDTLPPQAVERLYRHLIDKGLDMVYGCYRRISQDGRQQLLPHDHTGIMTAQEFLQKEVLTPGSHCGACANISHRELWHDDIFPPSDLRLPSEDVYMLVRLTQYIGRIGLYNDVVYDYYYNPSSLSIAGPLHRQELWREYFRLIRENLRDRGVLEQHEPALRGMEIDRLAFMCDTIDPTDPWYRQILSYPTTGFRAKTRLLQLLLRWPRLLRWCVTTNRRLHYSMGKRP